MWTRGAMAVLLGAVVLAGCERGERSLGPACRYELSEGGRELEYARANGLSDSVAWTKAASLLTAAKVQEQFGEYENCAQKAREARYHLSTIRG